MKPWPFVDGGMNKQEGSHTGPRGDRVGDAYDMCVGRHWMKRIGLERRCM